VVRRNRTQQQVHALQYQPCDYLRNASIGRKYHGTCGQTKHLLHLNLARSRILIEQDVYANPRDLTTFSPSLLPLATHAPCGVRINSGLTLPVVEMLDILHARPSAQLACRPLPRREPFVSGHVISMTQLGSKCTAMNDLAMRPEWLKC